MDNQCSRKVHDFITSTKADIQLVNPDDHRVNAAKCTIQAWKIIGLQLGHTLSQLPNAVMVPVY
jgi:hypothetical protein